MRAMTNSPAALAKEALKIGKTGLPLYSSHFSRKDFTQPQLFAILVLRQFFKTDYRGVIEMLQDFSDLRRVLKLPEVPHYWTLCYADRPLVKKVLREQVWVERPARRNAWGAGSPVWPVHRSVAASSLAERGTIEGKNTDGEPTASRKY